MIEIRRQALVRHTPEEMFDLVSDVEAYPRRFAWCAQAQVLAREGDDVLVARMDLRFAGFLQTLTTRNRFERPRFMRLHLLEGPLRALDGEWTFTPIGTAGCRVALALDFDVATGLIAMPLRLGFQALAGRMVEDFCAAAKKAYG